jgi:hypothetical protein
MNVGGTIKWVSSPANAVSAGTVVHVALTFDGSNIRLFLNGVLKGTTAASGAIVQKMSEDFILGPKEGTSWTARWTTT